MKVNNKDIPDFNISTIKDAISKLKRFPVTQPFPVYITNRCPFNHYYPVCIIATRETTYYVERIHAFEFAGKLYMSKELYQELRKLEIMQAKEGSSPFSYL